MTNEKIFIIVSEIEDNPSQSIEPFAFEKKEEAESFANQLNLDYSNLDPENLLASCKAKVITLTKR